MKDQTVLRPPTLAFFLILFAFLFQSSSIMATGGIRIIDGLSSNGGGVTTPQPPKPPIRLSGCDLTFELSFWIANLDTNPFPFQGDSGDNDPEADDDGPGPIYVHYSIGNDDVTFPLDLSNAFYFKDVNGEPVYQINYQFTTSLSEECNNAVQDIRLDYSFRTESGALYPIHAFKAPGDLFSCMVFDETCSDDCNGPCDPIHSTDPAWFKTLRVDCCSCSLFKDCAPVIIQPPHVTNGVDRNQPRTANPTIDQHDNLYKVFPNPFHTDFTVNVEHLATTNLAVEVYDATGKRMLQSQRSLGPNSKSMTFSTGNWAKGIYYVKVNSEHGQEVFKLIKVD